MARLTADSLRGVWAGVTMTWNEDYTFDAETYRANTERACRFGAHGVYTTGSTGEFYALDFSEFREMADIQAEICGRFGMPLQIGCCADNTREVLRYLEYAAGKPEVGAAQVVIPYWMEVNNRELIRFFQDIYRACPDLPLVHYNIPRAKRFLNGSDYLRILDVAPSLIGVKYTMAGSHFTQLQEAILLTPKLSYFVGENLLVSAVQLGARGTYSSLIFTDPAFMLKMHELAMQGQWREAISMQQTVQRFFSEAEAFIEERGDGTADPVFDKGLGVASGCLLGHQRCRPPYIGWSDETVIALREWMSQRYPVFLSPRLSEALMDGGK